MKRLLLALQFLTIIPFRDRGRLREEEMGSMTALFPLVGVIEGVVLVATAFLLLRFFPGEVTSGILILAIAAGNGIFHLDGLADTVDAVASRAGREKKLGIMKDSSTGAAGVTAIVLVLLLKYVMLNSLLSDSESTTFYTLLLLMPVMSRWVMVPSVYHGRPARQDGLGRVFMEYTGGKEMFTATVLLFVVLLCVLVITANGTLFLIQSVFVFPVLYIFSLVSVWFLQRQFGGLTGDNFGAVHELGTLVFLMTNLFQRVVLG
jgi:adenosylcobinamide-GDP ribazoletransferase